MVSSHKSRTLNLDTKFWLKKCVNYASKYGIYCNSWTATVTANGNSGERCAACHHTQQSAMLPTMWATLAKDRL